MKTVLPLTALGISYAVLFGFILATYDQLPEKIASHFDASGRTNGSMSREGLAWFLVIFSIVLPGMMIASAAITNRIPASKINLPNREYWLAPERLGETRAFLFRFMLWIASLTVLFIAGLHWVILQSNRPGEEPHLNGTAAMIVVGAFLAGLAAAIGLMMAKFLWRR